MFEEAGLADQEDYPPTFGYNNEIGDESSSTSCSTLSVAEPLEVDLHDNLPTHISNFKEDSTTSDHDESPADKWLVLNLTKKLVRMVPDHLPLFGYDTDESISIDDDKESITTTSTFDFTEYYKLKNNLPTSSSNIDGGPISTDESESKSINDDKNSLASCSTPNLAENSEFDLHGNLPTSSFNFEEGPISTNDQESSSSSSLLFNLTEKISPDISIPLRIDTDEDEFMSSYDTESSSTSCSSLTSAEGHINNITDGSAIDDSDTSNNYVE